MPLATLHRDGAVSVVTLNRPERLNAIGLPLLTDLHAALQAAQQDAGTRAIVLTGAGRAFCAGADLKDGAGEGTAADRGARYAQFNSGGIYESAPARRRTPKPRWKRRKPCRRRRAAAATLIMK